MPLTEMAEPPETGRLARVLFVAIVLAELAGCVWAIWQHRLPSGHDGFGQFTVQYYFLNNAIQSGEIPLWFPQLSLGTSATFWYGVQSSMVQSTLLWLPSLARHADLLTTYHLSKLVTELSFLTGTWLLARRFFRTPAVFFISVSIVGSCLWLDQPHFGLRLFSAIPLVLELGHRFLETGRWRWFVLAANLLALQAVVRIAYFMPVVSFVVCAYFAWFAVTNHRFVGARLTALRWRWPAGIALVLTAASFVSAYLFVTSDTGQMAFFNGRGLDGGRVDLDSFLVHGGLVDLRTWVGMLLNSETRPDLTLYAGILVVPLVVGGIVALDRRRAHFLLLAVTLLLFTSATLVSVALYRLWPMMQYFRHIGLVSPIVKVLFCFVAGIGFERWIDRPWAVFGWARARPAILCGALVFAATDVYFFKFRYLVAQSDVVAVNARFLTATTPMPYQRRREVDLRTGPPNAREAATRSFSRLGGVQYWTNDAFYFAEEVRPSTRVESWLLPLDQYLRMYWRTPIDDDALPRDLSRSDLPFPFPLEHRATGRTAGVTADKIRFFTRAHGVASAEDLVPLMTDAAYAGDLLFVLPPADRHDRGAVTPWEAASPVALSGDESRPLPYEVVRFDANNLVVAMKNPDGAAAWLSYADVWHPFWRATVNGQAVPIYRANMAFKAVPIVRGDNVVHFHFGTTRLTVLLTVVGANAAFWLCATAVLAWGVVGRPSTVP